MILQQSSTTHTFGCCKFQFLLSYSFLNPLGVTSIPCQSFTPVFVFNQATNSVRFRRIVFAFALVTVHIDILRRENISQRIYQSKSLRTSCFITHVTPVLFCYWLFPPVTGSVNVTSGSGWYTRLRSKQHWSVQLSYWFLRGFLYSVASSAGNSVLFCKYRVQNNRVAYGGGYLQRLSLDNQMY